MRHVKARAGIQWHIPVMRRLAMLIAAAAMAAPAAGESQQGDRAGFWFSADVGMASLSRSYAVTGSTRDTEFAMAFRGGYAWHPRLLLGAELGGWNIEGADMWDPRTGEGIRVLYAIAQYYPAAKSPFFVRGGVGAVKYWNNRPGELGASGSGGVLGAGYDIAISQRVHLTPSADLSWGQFDAATSPPGITQDQRYRAVTFRFGFTYR